MNEPGLWWGIGLFAAALAVAFLELLIPSAGILTILSGALAIAGVVAFWSVSPLWGVISLLALVIIVPLLVAFLLRIYPDTPIGRRMILSSDDDPDAAPPTPDSPHAALLGLTGEAISELRPVGMIRVDGQRLEALSEQGVIDIGARVRITAVEGTRIRVRRIE
ncbi:MAG: NfeD family protein [Phycisphaerales bacterium]